MSREENLRKDIANIDTKVKKLTFQKNILIMSLNTLIERKSEKSTSRFQNNEEQSPIRSTSFNTLK
jgi:hypothetical protein